MWYLLVFALADSWHATLHTHTLIYKNWIDIMAKLSLQYQIQVSPENHPAIVS